MGLFTKVTSKIFKIRRLKRNRHPKVEQTASRSSLSSDESPATSSASSIPNGDAQNNENDASTFVAPSPSGVMEWNMVGGLADAYSDRSIYGGSVTSDGLTLGNQSYSTSAFQSLVNGRSRCDTDDASFFQESAAAMNVDVVHVFCGPGKLGIALDTPDNSAPVVHFVKTISPIHDKVFPGDRLIAIDDEDVSYLTAVKISKIINRKSGNVTRKLTVLRATGA